jgi:hypothetical protein
MDTYRIRYGLHEREMTIDQIEELWRTCGLPTTTEIFINWEPGQERWASLQETVALPARVAPPIPPEPVPVLAPVHTPKPATPPAPAETPLTHDQQVLALAKAGWVVGAQLPTGTQLGRKRPKALLGPILIMIVALIGAGSTQQIDLLYAGGFSLVFLAALVATIIRLARSSLELKFVEKS